MDSGQPLRGFRNDDGEFFSSLLNVCSPDREPQHHEREERKQMDRAERPDKIVGNEARCAFQNHVS